MTPRHTTGLACQGLHLELGGRCLLAALDWQAHAGECWVVIGRNGAGKSTLLRTLAGLHRAHAGQVQLGGEPLAALALAERARRQAYLPQNQRDAFSCSVRSAILMARHPHRQGYWDSADDHAHASAALAALDIAHLAERDIRTLSGGERQRVAMAALLAQDTPVLLLDEPAAALDIAHQAQLMALLAQRCRDHGHTVVLVSHELNLTLNHASHALLLLEHGQWQASPVAELAADALSACLGHPLSAVSHAGRRYFLP